MATSKTPAAQAPRPLGDPHTFNPDALLTALNARRRAKVEWDRAHPERMAERKAAREAARVAREAARDACLLYVTHDGGRADAGYKGKVGDCAVRAICIITPTAPTGASTATCAN